MISGSIPSDSPSSNGNLKGKSRRDLLAAAQVGIANNSVAYLTVIKPNSQWKVIYLEWPIKGGEDFSIPASEMVKCQLDSI